MRTPLLLAGFAVALVAAAATPSLLTDPAEVAAQWKQTFEQARQPLLTPGPLGLTVVQPGPESSESKGVRGPRAPRVKRNGDVIEVPPLPPGWQLDPGFVHGNKDDTPPPGAKPWYYRGQKFWIVPIAAESTPGK